tara:strand:- start:1233 stop:1979 length:747 start_codon:yes stop_codon:yes gene_type:complete
MWPFNKRKYIVNFQCDDWSIRKYVPVRPANEFIPDKFANIPVFADKQPHRIDSTKTVRVCPGINQYMGLGYVIPAWCDIEIIPDELGNVQLRYSDPNFKANYHHPTQLNNLLDKKFSVRLPIKLDNPWRIYTANNWSLMYLPMLYWDDRNWEALPGVTDNDLGPLGCPINIMLKEPKYTLIKQGDPLVQIIPIYRQEIIARTSDVTQTALLRHKALEALRFKSFKGWTKFMSEKKNYKVDAKDLDLPE